MIRTLAGIALLGLVTFVHGMCVYSTNLTTTKRNTFRRERKKCIHGLVGEMK